MLCAGCADKMSAPEHTDSSHFDIEDYRICIYAEWCIVKSSAVAYFKLNNAICLYRCY